MALTGKQGGSGKGARPIGFIVTLVVSLVVLGLIGYFLSAAQYKSPNGSAGAAQGVLTATTVGSTVVHGRTLVHQTLSFSTYPDASGMVGGRPVHPGGNPNYPAYGPTNQFQIKAGALVTVTVRQYDSGGSLNNPFFATVYGTLTGTALFDGKSAKSINPNNIGHTFTVRGVPGYAPDFFMNVPLPANTEANVGDGGSYPHHTVVFSFIAPSTPGTLAWNCEFPCGWGIAGFGAVMGDYGYMSGFIHVV